MGQHAPLADRLAAVTRSVRHRSGFISAADLADYGFGRSAVSELVSRQLIERVAPGWYRSAALPWTYDDRVRQTALLGGDGCALAATTALHWMNVGARPERIVVISERSRRPSVAGRQLLRSTDLLPSDAITYRGVTTTTPARSLIDAARMVSVDQLHRLISAAVENTPMTESELAVRFLELARRGRPGVVRMRQCLAVRTDLVGPKATTFEQDFERIIIRGGFPTPLRQHRVRCDGKTYQLDHAWPEFGCWAECDSMLAHGTAEQLASDLERQNRIIAATTLVPMRFTYRDVHDRPGYVIERLAQFLPRR